MPESNRDVFGSDNFFGRPCCDRDPVSDYQGMTGGCWQFLEMVSDQDRGHRGVRLAKTANRFQKLFARGDVEPSAWFIQQEQFRRGNECPGYESPPPFALGEVRPTVACLARKTHVFDKGVRAVQFLRGWVPSLREFFVACQACQ